jgi:hypothetical protein
MLESVVCPIFQHNNNHCKVQQQPAKHAQIIFFVVDMTFTKSYFFNDIHTLVSIVVDSQQRFYRISGKQTGFGNVYYDLFLEHFSLLIWVRGSDATCAPI